MIETKNFLRHFAIEIVLLYPVIRFLKIYFFSDDTHASSASSEQLCHQEDKSFTGILMPTIETKVEIARPPEIVAEAFLDPANVVYWNKYLDRFEVVSGKPGEVGSIAHLHYIRKGRPYVLKDVLEEIIPNKYFRSSATGGWYKSSN